MGCLLVVEMRHGPIHTCRTKGEDHLANHFHPFLQGVSFLFCPLPQHKINLLPTMKLPSDTKSKPGVVIGSQCFIDVLQAVVSTVVSPGPQSQGAKRQGNVISHNEHIFQLNFLLLHPVGNSLAAEIYESGGF